MEERESILLTPHDESPVGLAMKRIGFWRWAKGVEITPRETFVNDGIVVYRYLTPPGLFTCLVNWRAGGEWELHGEIVFRSPKQRALR